MRMPVTVSLVIVAAATVAVAQDGVFKRRRLSETRLAPCHGSLSGGSQILPDGKGNHNQYSGSRPIAYCL